MTRAKLIIAFILVVLVLVIVLQNTAPMETHFLFVTVTMPRAAFFGITFLIGVAVGILIALGLSVKKAKKADNPLSSGYRSGL